MVNNNPALCHHFFGITQAQDISQIPANTLCDDNQTSGPMPFSLQLPSRLYITAALPSQPSYPKKHVVSPSLYHFLCRWVVAGAAATQLVNSDSFNELKMELGFINLK